ncbi:sodium:calcium antiporter [Aeromicrobium fastidiosum]|uniref:Sodium:calcium antiporter n=1 Tax=Aeromicrobium fastidiosum TaxID=52699 RepID=A0A641ANI8_9ACTN|nr:sodium:calcium antiporter [Aeromicrobium fastidiosum]KAA1376362.1 sodium:calcium antiporter [Aeromicrobium fastidiosum]MBP2391737.1 cation:H+ antiporter [Aeromicrobium fastidiosum]
MVHVLLLVVCAVAIYLSCEWFVNAIEWLGVRMKVGGVAVGTILAAAGTALPESVVTLMAVLFGSEKNGNDIAVGAAMGGPLVVGTLAYAVTGAMLFLRFRKTRAKALAMAGPGDSAPAGHDLRVDEGIDTRRLARDQVWFLSIFAFKVALGLVAFAIKPWLGLLFLAAYGVYFYREMTSDGEDASADDLEPLKLRPKTATPGTWFVVAQTIGSLVVIFAASQVFVKQLEWAGPALGLPAVVVALLLSPIATELPEIMNAIIWVRQGKANLALANISGSMMIQATVPSAIGIGFTSWKFDTPLMLAGFATLASVGYLLWVMHQKSFTAAKLFYAGGFYLVFAAGLVLTV